MGFPLWLFSSSGCTCFLLSSLSRREAQRGGVTRYGRNTEDAVATNPCGSVTLFSPSPALQISGFLPWTLVPFSEPFCDLARSAESNTQGAVHCPYLNHLEIHAAFEMFRFLCLPVLERTPSSPRPPCLHILACPSQSFTSYPFHSLLPSGAPSGNLYRLTFLHPAFLLSDPLSHSFLATQTRTTGGKNWPLNAPPPAQSLV